MPSRKMIHWPTHLAAGVKQRKGLLKAAAGGNFCSELDHATSACPGYLDKDFSRNIPCKLQYGCGQVSNQILNVEGHAILWASWWDIVEHRPCCPHCCPPAVGLFLPPAGQLAFHVSRGRGRGGDRNKYNADRSPRQQEQTNAKRSDSLRLFYLYTLKWIININ